MIEYSQALLLLTTTLVALSTIAYLGAVFAVRRAPRAAAVSAGPSRTTVVIDTGTAGRGVEVTGGVRHATLPRFSVTWWASRASQLALLLLTGSLVARWVAVGHAPLSNHYEFAVAFAWGMLVAQVFFEWRYRVRTVSMIVVPVILGMLVYASTLSYEPNRLMPALQNSPLLTLHVSSRPRSATGRRWSPSEPRRCTSWLRACGGEGGPARRSSTTSPTRPRS